MKNSDEDFDIWNSFLKGEEDAFDKIYSFYYKNLYEYGMRKYNNEIIVQDAIQNLFVRLWANRKGLSKTTNIKYYLFSSLKNQMKGSSCLRRACRYSRIEECGLDWTSTERSPS